MEKAKAIGHPQGASRPELPNQNTPLDIVIPYRSLELTSAALDYAKRLGEGLDIQIRLIEVHVVPFVLPIDKPNVARAHLENNLRNISMNSAASISAELVFARDWDAGFFHTLRPDSVVLIPIRKRWWRFHERRMAERIRKRGYQVFRMECG